MNKQYLSYLELLYILPTYFDPRIFNEWLVYCLYLKGDAQEKMLLLKLLCFFKQYEIIWFYVYNGITVI